MINIVNFVKNKIKNIESIVSFNSDMPKIIQEFKLKKS